MYFCKIPHFLAMLMLIYISACVYYIAMTRNIGTPFRDSLSKKQLEIKKSAANQRRNIFYTGLIGASILVYFIRPFSKCN